MALDFDGTTGYVNRASTPVTATPLTIFARFNADLVSTGANAIVSIQAGADSTHRFGLEARGDVAGDPVRAATGAGGTIANAASAAGYVQGTWHYGIALFESPTSRYVFLDGTKSAQNTTSRTPVGVSAIALASFNGTNFFDGKIAEAAIWGDAALDDLECAALSKGYSPRLIRPNKLVMHIEGRRSGVIDLRGAPFTVNGTVGITPHPNVIMPRRRLVFPKAAAAAAGQPFWKRFGGTPHAGFERQHGRMGF